MNLYHAEADDLPAFTRPVGNTSAILGREARLRCHVKNTKDSLVAWIRVDSSTILFMNEEPVTRNDRFKVEQISDGVWELRIDPVKRRDQGHYMCQINTNHITSIGFLEVLSPPDFDPSHTTSGLTVREGDPATLHCKGKGNPAPRIKWTRADRQTLTGISEKGTLHFKKTHRNDMAEYYCIIQNGIPPALSRLIPLNILHPPKLRINYKMHRVFRNELVHLSCAVSGYPLPEVYWTTQNHIVSQESFKHTIATSKQNTMKPPVVITTLNITFPRSYPKNKITYHCFANNSEGRSSESVTLFIQDEPKVEQTNIIRMEDRGHHNEREKDVQDTSSHIHITDNSQAFEGHDESPRGFKDEVGRFDTNSQEIVKTKSAITLISLAIIVVSTTKCCF